MYTIAKTNVASPIFAKFIDEVYYKGFCGDAFLALETSCDKAVFLYYNGKYAELVEEKKDYEVLSVIGMGGSVVYKKNYTYPECFDTLVKSTNNFSIHSVKRLSDGEVFTVGDMVETAVLTKPGVITSISLMFGTKMCLTVDSITSHISNFQKVKKPLFTTEDGVEIFEGDTIYGINNDWVVFSHYNDLQNKIKIWGVKPIFSTKEKAEEYVLLNKPCLSLNDVSRGGVHCVEVSIGKNVFNFGEMKAVYNYQKLIDYLKQNIKSKLNLQ